MIDPTSQEQQAMQATLPLLGEYVASIGMHRLMAHYTKEEMLTMIEVVVSAYQDHLQEIENAGL